MTAPGDLRRPATNRSLSPPARGTSELTWPYAAQDGDASPPRTSPRAGPAEPVAT